MPTVEKEHFITATRQLQEKFGFIPPNKESTPEGSYELAIAVGDGRVFRGTARLHARHFQCDYCKSQPGLYEAIGEELARISCESLDKAEVRLKEQLKESMKHTNKLN